MILSNSEILRAIESGAIKIDGLAGTDPARAPFNTTSVDLRLGPNLSRPKEVPATIDLRTAGIAAFIGNNSQQFVSTEEQPFVLNPREFVLGQTQERVSFPISDGAQCYSARVEGKSSLARCGILIHFTAPTIHSGFVGPITLEMINFGPNKFLLPPGLFVCQLIVETVSGSPVLTPSQFRNQTTPAGTQ